MKPLFRRPLAGGLVVAVASCALVAGCEKTTTTTQTPSGTVTTTTTIEPSADASAVMGKVNESLQDAAHAVESSAAASQALTKAGNVIEDSAITAEVKTRLLTDSEVKGLHIEVDTHDGVVTLSGKVQKAAIADRARSIARDAHGVKSVDSRLTVDPAA
jgi:hyperosmotically inducible periplasmic protein